MKNLNRKGLTLTELIVSFAIVAVAVVYFYQTLYTVRKLYTTAQTETQEYVDKNYAIRVVDSYIDKYGTTDLDGGNTSKTKICEAFSLKYLNKDNCSSVKAENVTGVANLKKITIFWNNGKSVSFNKADVKPVAKEYVSPILAKGYYTEGIDSYFFNGDKIKKGEVESITFYSNMNFNEENVDGSWDASFSGTGSVMAWYTDSNGNGKYELSIGGNGKVIFPKMSTYLFSNFENLVSINFAENIDTSDVVDMSDMFLKCKNLLSLDLSSFDTKKVSSETKVSADPGGMREMFSGCERLTSVTFSEKFDTSSVKSMRNMFSYCKKLQSIIFPLNFTASSVESMEGMFNYCLELNNIVFPSNFNTINLNNMEDMFYNTGITNIDFLSKFKTNKVTTIKGMFESCDKLEKVEFPKSFDTASLDDISSLFKYCYNLVSITFPEDFNTSNISSMSGLFLGCESLTEILFLHKGNIVSDKVSSIGGMFSGTKKLSADTLNSILLRFDTSNVTYMGHLFENSGKKISSGELILPQNFVITKVNSMEKMFYQSNFSKITFKNSIEEGKKLALENSNNMFDGCSNLSMIDFGTNFKTPNLKKADGMFADCTNLSTIDLSVFEYAKLSSMQAAFSGCSKLTYINISTFDLPAKLYVNSIFKGVPNSAKIYLKNSDAYKKVKGLFDKKTYYCKYSSGFSSC